MIKAGISFLLLLFVYAIYTYTQVTPNLVLSSHPLFWQTQQFLWQIGYHQRTISTLIYIILISGLFLSYFFMIKEINLNHEVNKAKWILIGAIAVLFISYPALSTDIFNYMFNAKMVVVYQADPHVKTALNFDTDPWVKYMHNIQSTAPYGYGWTALSLLPYTLGDNHLKLTLWLFRVFMLIGFSLLIWTQFTLKASKEAILTFALNPLVLIETVSNIHNDVWMMAFGFLALLAAKKGLVSGKWWLWVLASGLWGVSGSIKIITFLIPVGIALYFYRRIYSGKISFGLSQALVHALPLLTKRSGRFLPWYLIWPMSFMPFMSEKRMKTIFYTISFSAMLSYIPYLYTGGYSAVTILYRTLIIIIPPILMFIYLTGRDFLRHSTPDA